MKVVQFLKHATEESLSIASLAIMIARVSRFTCVVKPGEGVCHKSENCSKLS